MGYANMGATEVRAAAKSATCKSGITNKSCRDDGDEDHTQHTRHRTLRNSTGLLGC